MLRLVSSIKEEQGTLRLSYELSTKPDGEEVVIGSFDKHVTAVLSGKLSTLIKAGSAVARNKPATLAVSVRNVDVEISVLKVFVRGKPLVSARISAYVPAD